MNDLHTLAEVPAGHVPHRQPRRRAGPRHHVRASTATSSSSRDEQADRLASLGAQAAADRPRSRRRLGGDQADGRRRAHPARRGRRRAARPRRRRSRSASGSAPGCCTARTSSRSRCCRPARARRWSRCATSWARRWSSTRATTSPTSTRSRRCGPDDVTVKVGDGDDRRRASASTPRGAGRGARRRSPTPSSQPLAPRSRPRRTVRLMTDRMREVELVEGVDEPAVPAAARRVRRSPRPTTRTRPGCVGTPAGSSRPRLRRGRWPSSGPSSVVDARERCRGSRRSPRSPASSRRPARTSACSGAPTPTLATALQGGHVGRRAAGRRQDPAAGGVDLVGAGHRHRRASAGPRPSSCPTGRTPTPGAAEPGGRGCCVPVRARRPRARRRASPSSTASDVVGVPDSAVWVSTRRTARSCRARRRAGRHGRHVHGRRPRRRRPHRRRRRRTGARRRRLGALAGDRDRRRLRRRPVDLHDARRSTCSAARTARRRAERRRCRGAADVRRPGGARRSTPTRGSCATTGRSCATSRSTRGRGSGRARRRVHRRTSYTSADVYSGHAAAGRRQVRSRSTRRRAGSRSTTARRRASCFTVGAGPHRCRRAQRTRRDDRQAASGTATSRSTAGLLLDGVAVHRAPTRRSRRSTPPPGAPGGRPRSTTSRSSSPPTGATCWSRAWASRCDAYSLRDGRLAWTKDLRAEVAGRPRPGLRPGLPVGRGTTPGCTCGWTTAPWPSWADRPRHERLHTPVTAAPRRSTRPRRRRARRTRPPRRGPGCVGAHRWRRRRGRARRARAGRRAGACSTPASASGSPTWPTSPACCSPLPDHARRAVALGARPTPATLRGRRHGGPVGDRRPVPPRRRRAARHRPGHRRGPVDHARSRSTTRCRPADRGDVPVGLGAVRHRRRGPARPRPCAARTWPAPAQVVGTPLHGPGPDRRHRAGPPGPRRPAPCGPSARGRLVVATPGRRRRQRTPTGTSAPPTRAPARPPGSDRTPRWCSRGPVRVGDAPIDPEADADRRRRSACCSPAAATRGCWSPDGAPRRTSPSATDGSAAARPRRHPRVDAVPEPRRSRRASWSPATAGACRWTGARRSWRSTTAAPPGVVLLRTGAGGTTARRPRRPHRRGAVARRRAAPAPCSCWTAPSSPAGPSSVVSRDARTGERALAHPASARRPSTWARTRSTSSSSPTTCSCARSTWPTVGRRSRGRRRGACSARRRRATSTGAAASTAGGCSSTFRDGSGVALG